MNFFKISSSHAYRVWLKKNKKIKCITDLQIRSIAYLECETESCKRRLQSCENQCYLFPIMPCNAAIPFYQKIFITIFITYTNGVNAKVFYLLRYSIALRTTSLLPLDTMSTDLHCVCFCPLSKLESARSADLLTITRHRLLQKCLTRVLIGQT